MKVTRDQISAMTVRRVAPGEILVGRETVRDNVVLTADQVIERWTAGDVSRFAAEDFAAIIASRPEIIVLGTGWRPVLPPKELVFAMARHGIGFESMDTPAACRTFNILINEGRRAAAVLIVNDSPQGA
jgi:uncharacterized protein